MRYSTDIVVIDLEASCPAEDEGNNSVDRSNIIEIGAVRLDRRSLEITARFSELVQPADYPVTPFISGLTGITTEMVAGKETFERVGRRFGCCIWPTRCSARFRWHRTCTGPARSRRTLPGCWPASPSGPPARRSR